MNNRRRFCKINLGPQIFNHGFIIKPLEENGQIQNPLQDDVYIIACCETPDNQIDFVRLTFDPFKFDQG